MSKGGEQNELNSVLLQYDTYSMVILLYHLLTDEYMNYNPNRVARMSHLPFVLTHYKWSVVSAAWSGEKSMDILHANYHGIIAHFYHPHGVFFLPLQGDGLREGVYRGERRKGSLTGFGFASVLSATTKHDCELWRRRH